MPKRKPQSVDAETLRAWQDKGIESGVLEARLEYTEIEGRSRYARGMVGRTRVYPSMLPTQASGRWSTTNPPLVNFPAHDEAACPRCKGVITGEYEPHYLREIGGDETWCPRSVREVIIPDRGWWWLHYDEDGVEARLNAALSGDQKELEAFDNRWDVHTLTACAIFGMDRPPLLTKAIHTSDDPSAVAWRLKYNWGGDQDRRRHVSKTIRYALQYALDEKGALNSNELYKLGLKREDIMKFGRQYLRSKPEMVSTKRKVWDEAIRTNVAYTFLGRRRRLFGEAKDKMKQAWSHRVSGSNSDMMNSNIIMLQKEFPESHLVLNSHDGEIIAFPVSTKPGDALARAKPIVERTWDVDGYKMVVPGSWEWVDDEGVNHRF